eukprot:gene161-4407_t
MKKFLFSSFLLATSGVIYNHYQYQNNNDVFEEKEIEKFYKNKTILITGASMGLGEGFAYKLSKYNTNLVLCARSTDKLLEVAENCMKKGAKNTLVITCDVTIENDCKRVVEEAKKTFQKIDILILNAGISGSVPFYQIEDLSIYEKMMKVNFMGYVNMTHFSLPEIKKSDGRILVISSMSGKLGIPLRTAYCSSKFAVNGFFEVLRNELFIENPKVKITIGVPGWIDTDMRKRHLNETQKSYDKNRMISIDECVNQSLYALKIGKREERYIGITSYLPFLSTFTPELVDKALRYTVYKKSKL